jgi:hypothetical protein
MKRVVLTETKKGLVLEEESGEKTFRKSITDFLLHDFLTEEYDRTALYAFEGFRGLYRLIDFPRLVDAGFLLSPVMGLKDIKALKISLPKSGKKPKRSEDRLIWYLRDISLLVQKDMTLDQFRKTFPGSSLLGSLSTYAGVLKDHFDVELDSCPTLSGLSMSAFRKHYKDQGFSPIGVSGRFRTICEDSYFGAHTYCFNVIPHEKEVCIDANSHYGSVMLKYPLPDGEPTFRIGEDWEEMDLVFATVLIPERVLPILKARIGTGKEEESPKDIKKVGTGRVTGWYWGFELKMQEKLGGIIEEVGESIRWEGQTSILQGHIEKCRSLRNTDRQGPLGLTVKQLQNGLYGKFGQRPSNTEYLISNIDPGGDAWPVPIETTSSPVMEGWLWERPMAWRPTGPDLIHWASYIVARARVDQVRAIDMIGWQNVDYSDTDSIHCEAPYLSGEIETLAGEDYGQWKLEKVFSYWQASGSKRYGGQTWHGAHSRVQAGISRNALAGHEKGEKVMVVEKRSFRKILAQKMSAESRERVVTITDPSVGTLKFDREGFWIPDFIDQNPEDFLSRRKMTAGEKAEIAFQKRHNPRLFERLPVPDDSALGRYQETTPRERMEEIILRAHEKSFEHSIKNKKNRFFAPEYLEKIGIPLDK